MRQNLLETYGKQLRVAEAYMAKNFEGRSISGNTQLATAVLLDNTNRWITEALSTSATARTDLGDWKKFCLNLTNIAVPSLIANDLVIVHPMTSYSGSVAYLKYVTTTEKGKMKKGTELNSVFGLGDFDEKRIGYTSQVIVENVNAGSAGYTTALSAEENGISYIAKEGGIDVRYATLKLIDNAGVVTYPTVTFTEDGNAVVTGLDTSKTYKVAYVSSEFQMNHVPSKDIPSIGPKLERIALVAEPRRIGVKYDQITAFQAKTDYGFSLDKQIAEQACGELALEIDCEIVDMLYDAAKEAGDALTWSKTLPVGVSKFEHYMGFLEVLEAAKAIIYKRTKKFQPNYMVIAPDVMQVLRFINGFNAIKKPKMNGPYKVGEFDDGMGVYVTPQLGAGEFFIGLNGSDMMSSAGVYAPYMAIVPTMLLGTPDGGLMQGFSTWYAKAILNGNLLIAGKITD